MGLFDRKEAQTVPAQPPPQTRASVDSSRGGLFSKHRRTSSPSSSEVSPVGARHSTTSSTTGGLGSVFRRGRAEDPDIVDARQRVAAAEKAERDADAALMQARTAVKAAREHVRQLERDAAEEARLAKIKQGQAKDLSNRAKPLGRHG